MSKKKRLTRAQREALSERGRRGGLVGGPAAYEAMSEDEKLDFHSAGGKASAAALTARQRVLRAKKAVAARERKKRELAAGA